MGALDAAIGAANFAYQRYQTVFANKEKLQGLVVDMGQIEASLKKLNPDVKDSETLKDSVKQFESILTKVDGKLDKIKKDESNFWKRVGRADSIKEQLEATHSLLHRWLDFFKFDLQITQANQGSDSAKVIKQMYTELTHSTNLINQVLDSLDDLADQSEAQHEATQKVLTELQSKVELLTTLIRQHRTMGHKEIKLSGEAILGKYTKEVISLPPNPSEPALTATERLLTHKRNSEKDKEGKDKDSGTNAVTEAAKLLGEADKVTLEDKATAMITEDFRIELQNEGSAAKGEDNGRKSPKP